ncbi:MAG: dTDP-glucose 4,6-dehydratase [Candidatus Omnitrophota bacterium]
MLTNNKKVLITGGAGFIGSNFIRYILNKNPFTKIINLDKLTYCGNLNNLKDLCQHKNYKFVKGDICNTTLVDKTVKGCKVIINFAAQTHVDRSIKNAAEFIKTNVQGTHVLLEAAKRHKLDLFVQISTDEVYGSILNGKFCEASLLNPSSPYSASKASADLLCVSYYKTYKLPVIITRSSNNFGPYQYPEKIIPLFITNAIEGKRLPVYGDGLNIRDWIYVLDNCAAIELAAQKGKIGEIYNIGGSNELNNLQLTKMVLSRMGKSEKLIKFVTDRPAHDRRYALDITKIKSLGWQSNYDFNTAISDTIQWYINNKQWWQRLKRY